MFYIYIQTSRENLWFEKQIQIKHALRFVKTTKCKHTKEIYSEMDIRRDGQITYHNVNCKILAKGRNAFFCWVGYSKIRMLKQSGTVGQKLTITQNCNSKCYTCLCMLIYMCVQYIYILAKIINILYSKYTPYRIFLRIYT